MKTHVLVCAVLGCAGLGCAMLFVGTAGADAIPFAYSGPGISVSGTFFGSNNFDGSWTITGVDATYNQIQVSGVVAVGLDPRFLYNNLYYNPGHADFAVDYLGIVFAVPGVGEVNLCSYTPSDGCGSGSYASILWDGGNYQFTQVSQLEAGPAVPEPSTLALWGGALAAAAAAARRYFRARVHA